MRRPWSRRPSPLLIAGIVLAMAGCAGASPSGSPGSAPATEPSPGGPTASPVTPSGAATDPGGPTPSASSAAAPTMPPFGAEVHELDCRDPGPCSLRYLPSPGPDAPGWPVQVPGTCRGTARATTGTVYALCDGTLDTHLLALDPDGALLPGWPLTLRGAAASVYEQDFTISCGASASSVRLRPDGSVLFAVVDGSTGMLHAATADGRSIDGWPRPFPGDPPGNDGIGGNGCRGFDVFPDGGVVAWGYEGVEAAIELQAARTVFARYEADGTAIAGWPRGSVGAASSPAVLEDGSIVYSSASGRLWRHLPDGTIAPGWPVELPEPRIPLVTPDQRIVVVTNANDGQALALDADGRTVAGWPVDFDVPIQSACLFGDTPCIGDAPPAVGPDGTLYVSLADGSLVALDAAGEDRPGWPVALGPGGGRGAGLSVDAAGRLLVQVARCDPPSDETADFGCGGGTVVEETRTYSPAGELLDTRSVSHDAP